MGLTLLTFIGQKNHVTTLKILNIGMCQLSNYQNIGMCQLSNYQNIGMCHCSRDSNIIFCPKELTKVRCKNQFDEYRNFTNYKKELKP